MDRGSKQHQEPSGEGEAHIRPRTEVIDSILSTIHRARFEPADNPDGPEPAERKDVSKTKPEDD